MQVLRVSGVESESPLAFAALQRLLRPVLHHLGRLPAPQSRALLAAFGAADVDADTDRFRVFLAALSLLSDAAAEAPVLAVVDDAQWLDDASAAALLFIARRLVDERIALLLAAREGDVRRFDADLPELVLTGLDASAAAELLSARAGTPVPPEVGARLVALTDGNPLALVELPDALPAAALAGTTPLPPRLPVTAGVERVFLDRARPPPARPVPRPPPPPPPAPWARGGGGGVPGPGPPPARRSTDRAARGRRRRLGPRRDDPAGGGDPRGRRRRGRRRGAIRAGRGPRRATGTAPPTGPLGGVPRRDEPGAPPRPPRTGRCPARQPRRRPPGLAPRGGHDRPRRGDRAGARAGGGPRTAQGRPGGGGCRPGARRGADACAGRHPGPSALRVGGRRLA